ncbi:hypothetical protein [uncultured Methanobrevibacter sp.]|uniref:hypothetical protein n=1 Tax=uncultured Methanobrevibacter sp. TaxID=253161 RepID=UPI0025FBA92D|nr:hypothetical protein [uncultured Methanobrevibacter sp.]
MDRNKEYIIAAAYKLKPEFVTKSVVYKDKTVRLNDEDYDDINTIEIGRCHADIIHRHKDRIDQKDGGGFYTNFGRYVDRREAYQIALANEQIEPSKTCDGAECYEGYKPRLFSEDVFWSYDISENK